MRNKPIISDTAMHGDLADISIAVDLKLLLAEGLVAIAFTGFFAYVLIDGLRQGVVSWQLGAMFLLQSIWWLCGQLKAIQRLFRFGFDCSLNQKSIQHFALGLLPWSQIRSAEMSLSRTTWGGRNMRGTSIVIRIDDEALGALQARRITNLAMSRYVRFCMQPASIAISCDFLQIEPRRFLWHVRKRVDRYGGSQIKDLNGNRAAPSLLLKNTPAKKQSIES